MGQLSLTTILSPLLYKGKSARALILLLHLGYGGLVGLHALNGAEAFYRRMSMSECGPDEEKEKLVYFEWYRPRDSVLEWWDNGEEE